MKKVIIIAIVMITGLFSIQAANLTPMETTNPQFFYVANDIDSDYFLFDEKGVYVEPTATPTALRGGWIVLSGQEPVTIKGPYATIVLQRESILTVGSIKRDKPSFYLVAGSASFLVTPSFLGKFEVSTPIGIYKLQGSGELFVSSDVSELVFSLGGKVQVLNAITRQLTDLPSFTYLNLADPLVTVKEISRQTYETLSINPKKATTRILPSAGVEDGLFFQSPMPLSAEAKKIPASPKAEPEKAKPVEAPPAATPIKVEETTPVATPAKADAAPVKKVSEKMEPKETVTTASEVFDVYIVHTNDVLGQIEDEGIGYARLATLLDWGRTISDRNLLLDAGNTTSGSSLAEAFEGETVAVLLDMLGYDAIAPGPADYAYGITRLREAAKTASQFSQVKILAANILDSQGSPLFEPYGIFDLKGYNIGVIGISIPPKEITGITSLNDTIVNNAQLLVDEVAAKSDFVILLGNTGDAPAGVMSTDIAQHIHGIDLIIDGEAVKTPDAGIVVGSTLIVNAEARLQSVGVVAIHVVDREAITIDAAKVREEDVDNPEQSALANYVGITHVPANSEVMAYIEQQKARYAAQQIVPVVTDTVTVAEKPVPVEPKTEAIPVAEPTVEEKESPLVIQQPLGITGSPDEAPASSFDWGVSTRFTVSHDGVSSGGSSKIGLSINPFFNHNAFAIGLQAFFLTDGDLFSPSTYDISNMRSESGLAATVSSAMRFLDYVRYGQAGDTLYVLADDTTPISFGTRTMVNHLGVASGPYEEHLGLYSSIKIGNVGIELFADDLYFSNYLANKKQTGGGRISYAFSPTISLGLSSLLTADSSKNINAYPALDLIYTVKNERKLRIDTFINLATMMSLDSFSFDTIYDSAGSSLEAKLPNFQFAGGLDVRTLHWDFRLVGAVLNSSDGLLALNAFNQSNYSGIRMLKDTGIYYTVGGEARYTGNKFGFSGSWQIPLEKSFTRIVTLDNYSTVTGDMLALEASYTGSHFEAALGLRRVGFLTAARDLLDFSGGFSGFVDNSREFIRPTATGTEATAQPYIALRYQQGLFSIYGDVSLARVGLTNTFIPRFNFGATITIGKKAQEQAKELVLAEKVFSDQPKNKKFSFSGDVRTTYTKAFTSGPSDKDYVTVQPIITLAKGDSFSFGLGPKIALDLNAMELYAHDNEPFSFGSSANTSTTFGKVYDITTDLFTLIDHVTFGNEGDAFRLNVNRDLTVSMGPLVRDLTTLTDSTLQDALGLKASLDTKIVDLDLFVHDLSNLQLGGLGLGITPFKNYKAEFGLSTVASLKLSDANKRIDLLPTLDLTLPIIGKENFTLDATGSISTMVGYDSTNGFKQLFYSSGSSFLNNFNNYLFHGGLDLSAGNFELGLAIAMQKGALSYGMFNPLFIRERSASMLSLLDSAWTGSVEPTTFTIAGSTGWENEYLDLQASYNLPLSASLAPKTEDDLLVLKGTASLGMFDIALGYTRRGFAPAVETLLTDSTTSLATRAKNFIADSDSILHAGVGVTQGPLTFSATISTLAIFTPVAGSWNGQNGATPNPALTVGVDINLF